MNEEDIAPEVENRIAARQIIDGLAAGKTYTQIAKDMGVSRSKLYSVMRRSDVRELMLSEVVELETKLQDTINTMLESDSPTDRRDAMKELGKMVRHIQDKGYPTLFRSENLNLNINAELKDYKEHLATITQTINMHPPEWKKEFWKTYSQAEADRKNAKKGAY